jgi:dienelactone hydrolase
MGQRSIMPDLATHAARLAPNLEVVRPTGPGPFPVVVQMHGCGGVQPLQARYARAARDAGVAAVIIDSLAPRGIGRREAQLTVCTGARLRGAERAVDMLATLHWLQGQPWADTNQVAAAGWSHGAWAIMEAMVAASPQDVVAPLKLTVLFYPYAGFPARTHTHGWGDNKPKIFACLAGRDAVVGRLAPRRALRRLQADGLDIDILDLPDATHCFDDEYADDPRTCYRPDLASQAQTAYAAALVEALGVGEARDFRR